MKNLLTIFFIFFFCCISNARLIANTVTITAEPEHAPLSLDSILQIKEGNILEQFGAELTCQNMTFLYVASATVIYEL